MEVDGLCHLLRFLLGVTERHLVTPAPSRDAACLLLRLERRSKGKEPTAQLRIIILKPSAAVRREGSLLLPGSSPDRPRNTHGSILDKTSRRLCKVWNGRRERAGCFLFSFLSCLLLLSHELAQSSNILIKFGTR